MKIAVCDDNREDRGALRALLEAVMNDEARLYDYMNVFDEDSYYASSMRFDSAIKKVFKPDIQYREILVPCFPQTFCKGRNWENDLDYCIDWYILSPFDQEILNKLKSAMNDDEIEIQSFVQQVMDSKQLKKCVSYIMKKRELQEEQKENIKNQYQNFVEKFFTVLYKNKDTVLHQFKETK